MSNILYFDRNYLILKAFNHYININIKKEFCQNSNKKIFKKEYLR